MPALHPGGNLATFLTVKATLEVINQMQTDGVIDNYAIDGAVGAVRLKLLKVAVQVTVSVRRVCVRLEKNRLGKPAPNRFAFAARFSKPPQYATASD